MKLQCFVLPSLVLSLLGHPSCAVPDSPSQKRISGPSGYPSSGGVVFGVRSSDLVHNIGSNYGGHLGGSGEGRSGPNGALTENIGGATTDGLGSDFGDGGGSFDAGGGGTNHGAASLGTGYGTSTGLVGSPLVKDVGAPSPVLRGGVPRHGGAGGDDYISGHGGPGREHSRALNIGAGPFGGSQPGRATGAEGPLSSTLPVDVGGAYDVLAGSRSPVRADTGTGVSVGDSAAGRPRLPGSSGAEPVSIGITGSLGTLPGSPSRSSPGRYGAGFPGDLIPTTGSGDLSGGPGAGPGEFGRGAGERIVGLGTGVAGVEGGRTRFGLGDGAEGGLLSRLRARAHARARTLAAARARARSRAKARARARALARAKLRARLRAVFRKKLSIRGGINVGVDKAAELGGAGLLGGDAGLQGEGDTAAGLAGYGGSSASAEAGSVLQGGITGHGGSYRSEDFGDYDFYSE